MQVTGQSVHVLNLGAEEYEKIMTIKFDDTIPAIINYSKHPKPEEVVVSLSPYERIQVQKILGEAQIQNAHKVIPPSAFQIIIDNVQSKIIDLFINLNNTVFDGEIDLKSPETKEEIHQVITNNFTAGIIQTGSGVIDTQHSTIAANADNSLSPEVIAKLLSLTDNIDRIIRENDEEHDEIAQDIIDIKSELSETKPSPMKDLKVKESTIDRVKTSATGMKTSIEYCLSDIRRLFFETNILAICSITLLKSRHKNATSGTKEYLTAKNVIGIIA